MSPQLTPRWHLPRPLRPWQQMETSSISACPLNALETCSWETLSLHAATSHNSSTHQALHGFHTWMSLSLNVMACVCGYGFFCPQRLWGPPIQEGSDMPTLQCLEVNLTLSSVLKTVFTTFPPSSNPSLKALRTILSPFMVSLATSQTFMTATPVALLCPKTMSMLLGICLGSTIPPMNP